MLQERMIKQNNGIYKKHAEFRPTADEGAKAYRSNDLANSVITVNDIRFNIDETSMDRIDRLIEMANFQYNRAVYNGETQDDAYVSTYHREVNWKSADNEFHTVTIETLAEVQEKALINMNDIWQKYG